MFQFPGLAPFTVLGYDSKRVSPFGHPRIYACLQLPEAYRSLPRPSSADTPRDPPYALNILTKAAYVKLL